MSQKTFIMIVDDDVSVLDVLRQSLSMEGYTCEAFTRGEDALEALERLPAEVMLTDIVMPGMRGLELVGRAKRLRPEMTAIVMTGFVEEFTYDEAIRLGAADFIKKPFTVQELLIRIKHAKLQDHLRELSNTDELTGLSNRRGFFAFAQQQMKNALRNRERMVLFFTDLDDLKIINDTFGHVAGDHALADAARILVETFRDSDIIARMGGDEFAVILGNAPDAGIETVRNRIEKRLVEYNARREGSFQLALSVGLTIFDPDKPNTLDELIRQADERMYDEKLRRKAAKGTT